MAESGTVESSEWRPKGAAAKLAYIQTHIANPDKSGYNDFHKFKYVQEHSILELLRPYLREFRCAVIPSPAAGEVRVEDATTAKGKSQKLVTLVGSIVFVDTDEPVGSSDREIRVVVTAGGADDLDKAHAKAQTVLVKYGLQKMFLIPTERIEDGDEAPVGEGVASEPRSETAKGSSQLADAPSPEVLSKDQVDALVAFLKGTGIDSKSVGFWLASKDIQPARVPAGLKVLTPGQAVELKDWVKGELEEKAA